MTRSNGTARAARRPPGTPVARAALPALALLAALPALAYDRNDALAELDAIAGDPAWNDARVHLAGDPPDPGVGIGEPFALEFGADRPAHFTLLLVDPRGELSVVAPHALSGDAGRAVRAGTFPPVGTGELVQGEPAGLQTVYLVATERPLPPAALGIDPGSDLATSGRDPERIAALARTLSDDALSGRRAVDRYEYLVDADVQVGTRAMRRELEMRLRQVDALAEGGRTGAGGAAGRVQSEPLAINDIRFETGSATLTATGRAQLDVVGSELLRQSGTRGRPLRVALEGHTDDVGTDADNEALALARAESARRYLVEAWGLEERTVEIGGRGERAPLVPNVDAASRERNRRVEIRLLGG